MVPCFWQRSGPLGLASDSAPRSLNSRPSPSTPEGHRSPGGAEKRDRGRGTGGRLKDRHESGWRYVRADGFSTADMNSSVPVCVSRMRKR